MFRPARRLRAASARRRSSRSSGRRSSQRDLLLARRRRRERARADAARLPRRRRSSSSLTAMTYVEGASLHQERAGSTVFARYAFNELWSFVAGWAVLLDFLILIAVTAFVATNYLAAFWAPLGERRAGARDRARDHRATSRCATSAARAPAAASSASRRSCSPTSSLQLLDHRRSARSSSSTSTRCTTSIDLGTSPRWEDLHVRADGLDRRVHEPRVGVRARRRGRASAAAACKRLIASATASVLVIYVGISLVAVAALPITPGAVAADRRRARRAGARARRDASTRRGWPTCCATSIAALATLTLVVAAHAAMLGLSRLAYSLATQPPDPERARAPAPEPRRRRTSSSSLAARAGGGARRPARPRVPRRHLRVRRDARLPHRARVDLRAALPRARPRRGPTGSRCRCASAAATCRCRPCSAR